MAFQFAFQGVRHPIIASNGLVSIWRSEGITLEDVAGPLCWYRVGRRAPVDAMVRVRHVDVVLRIPYAKRRGFEYAEAVLAVTPKAIRPLPVLRLLNLFYHTHYPEPQTPFNAQPELTTSTTL